MSIFDYKDSFKEIEHIPCKLIWESPDKPENPEVSIVMPVYKNHRYFKFALQSALNQSFANGGGYEIVVVDNYINEDNPNQRIVEEFNDSRVRYFRNSENIGMVGNWNRCIMIARAPKLTFLHDDDMFMPNTLSEIMTVGEKYPSKMILPILLPIDMDGKSLIDLSEYKTIRRFGIFETCESAPLSLARIICTEMSNLVATLFVRKHLIELGGFHADAYPAPDYEMAVRYAHRYGAIHINKPKAYYRYAVNTSYQEYPKMAAKWREISEEMINKIHLPKWILKSVVNTHFKQLDNAFHAQFAPNDDKKMHVFTKMELRIAQIYRGIINFIEDYKISL